MQLRAQTGHGAPQLLDAAGVAAIADHLIKARGAQAGMLRQRLATNGRYGSTMDGRSGRYFFLAIAAGFGEVMDSAFGA